MFVILQHSIRNKIPSRNISGIGSPGIKFPDKEKRQEPIVTFPSLEFKQQVIVSICFEVVINQNFMAYVFQEKSLDYEIRFLEVSQRKWWYFKCSALLKIILIFFTDLLFFQDQQEALNQEYNPDGSDNPTDFSNPMYESFPDLAHPPASAVPTKISFADLSTSSDLKSPIPANFSTSFQASADEKMAIGFQPTTHDTGKDTQQLIESDAEDWIY